MRYVPEEPAVLPDLAAVTEFMIREHRRIAVALAQTIPSPMEELHAEPAKLRDFMIVAADGTDWDPGSGQGVYAYYNGTWNKLG